MCGLRLGQKQTQSVIAAMSKETYDRDTCSEAVAICERAKPRKFHDWGIARSRLNVTRGKYFWT